MFISVLFINLSLNIRQGGDGDENEVSEGILSIVAHIRELKRHAQTKCYPQDCYARTFNFLFQKSRTCWLLQGNTYS